MFPLGRADFGKPLQITSFVPPVDLRSLVDKAPSSRCRRRARAVEHRRRAAKAEFLDVIVTPLMRDGVELGISITFNT